MSPLRPRKRLIGWRAMNDEEDMAIPDIQHTDSRQYTVLDRQR